MSRDTWFRRTSWSAEDAAAFHERLGRSRTSFHKAQYLRIQAFHLQEVGSEPLLRAALELVDDLIANYPDASQLSSAYLQRAQCLIRLGEEEKGIQAFRDSIAARKALPGMGNNGHVDFAEFAVLRGRTELFPEVTQALADFGENDPWPLNQFRMATALAFIAQHQGNRESATRNARIALAAADATQSPFRYHGQLGLVEDPTPDVIARLRSLAGAPGATADDGRAMLPFRWIRAFRRR